MIPEATTIVLMGRSGCGKDTQLEFLLKRPDFDGALKINSGDNVRVLAQKDTLIGKKVKQLIDAGALIPLWLVSSLWVANIGAGLKGGEKIVMDGAPRLPGEGELLDEVLAFVGRAPSVAILIDISSEESMKRLLSRGRSDDTEGRIKNRLSWFNTVVKIVLDYYKKEGRLLEINGEQSKEAVFSEIEKKLEEHFT
ncbi:TPA: hypothetical protein DCZ79_03130 [Candidatus Nomurabacteria bacterium]|uniref:Adenylate kinase n=1 Tax=Candidatus Giovannonibacteria bacterium GW2011_GWF2_42_19 TaxID=1618659 RepID=A0A0G1BK44_9BACT|nr:MAG: Adenylate kinase [Candidatus Giovannonibacteria bacterium GW2011_GWF2_42_19]HBB54457.1 hypothetical protein [Candidatus Nomurabacteria bacterium]